MSREKLIEINDRTKFVRQIVQSDNNIELLSSLQNKSIPKVIVQFWDNIEQIPRDVRECISSWKVLDAFGYKRVLFNKEQAAKFILNNYSQRHLIAFRNCYHPAMESDYFRLCYILAEGGCYIDADDIYNGGSIDKYFSDDRLKVQPLCYDAKTNTMVSPKVFTLPGATSDSWIFYFNNNPIIAGSGDPVLKFALEKATSKLEEVQYNRYPEIQSTTGPGNLTDSIFQLAIDDLELPSKVQILKEWDDIATSKWPLSYRNDSRNWRFSNSIPFRR